MESVELTSEHGAACDGDSSSRRTILLGHSPIRRFACAPRSAALRPGRIDSGRGLALEAGTPTHNTKRTRATSSRDRGFDRSVKGSDELEDRRVYGSVPDGTRVRVPGAERPGSMSALRAGVVRAGSMALSVRILSVGILSDGILSDGAESVERTFERRRIES
jgi:hypothetical protein